MDTPNRPDSGLVGGNSSSPLGCAVPGTHASTLMRRLFALGVTLRRPRFTVALAFVAVAVFGGTALHFYRQQSQALAADATDAQFTPDGRLRPLAEIRDALRSMKLVTTELRGEASSAFESRLWRGNASASVAAPVIYLYGVDLSRLDVLHLGTAWLPGVCVVTIPEPERIAVEVDIDHRREDVSVSGLRLRSRAGEYLLGRARVGVQSQARLAALTPEQAARVREDAARQVAALVNEVVGSSARVEIRFCATADAPIRAADANAAAWPPPLRVPMNPAGNAAADGGVPRALIARMGRSEP